MKRVNKVYCLVLALVAASALAAPFVFHHGAGPTDSEAALQLDGGGRANSSGATTDVSAGHIGSDGPPTIGASYADIEHFSFRPVMGDIDDSHAAPDGTLLNVGNLPFPVGAASSAGSAQAYDNAGSASGVPGTPAGLNGPGMAFNLPFGSTPSRNGAVQSVPESAAFLPLSLPGSGDGSGDSAANNGSNGSDTGAGNAAGGMDGAGGTPGNTEGVFNPAFAAPLNNSLPDTADAGGAASADVPEPGTIALFGFGLLGFAAARRRAAARASR
ncbi:PEP-CTERM sorting domain-containing protein [Noviherbaspirillum pedocola]|uniref:PEP-CTERM sorting domain-containing protein n=1 Tax=Noviherbaspirillum pedocola TaxID=2801341 RepID=A0A934W8N5_9BURK|nr:PEP-CTERM sorting domain-containing protein [Noviherbaspirillum pedocola]MBK4738852.1 PEP-CTERM sorting domain-containing protein [Noviherbaspirillum pedocola]